MNTEMGSMPKKDIARQDGDGKAHVNKIWWWHPTFLEVSDYSAEIERAVRDRWACSLDSQGRLHVFHFFSMTEGKA